jgi:hypothetical protein
MLTKRAQNGSLKAEIANWCRASGGEGAYIAKGQLPEISAMRANSLTRPLTLVLALGVLFTLFQPRAWGAAGCTGAPAVTGPTVTKPTAKCAKSASSAAKASGSPSVAAVAAPVPASSWKSVLDPLSAGGWAYISDGPTENPSAVYASSHNILHNGNVVTAWMRWEFSRPQAEVYPLHYLSAVTREELDCDARAYRRAAVIYYTRNNLQEKGPSFTALNDDTTWKVAIPGSEPDAMLNWGCTPPVTRASAVSAKAPAAAKAAAARAAASSAPGAASSAPAPAAGGTDLHTSR